MPYIPITVIDLNVYTCEPVFVDIQTILLFMMNRLALFNASLESVDPETGEITCTPNDVARKALMSELLKDMGLISTKYPFNRAVFPLPSGDALEVDI